MGVWESLECGILAILRPWCTPFYAVEHIFIGRKWLESQACDGVGWSRVEHLKAWFDIVITIDSNGGRGPVRNQ